MLYVHLHCKVFNLTSLWLFFHDRYFSLAYTSFDHISTSLDVFKSGILILDIISGKKKIEFHMPPEQQILSQSWVYINNLVASCTFKITLDP